MIPSPVVYAAEARRLFERIFRLYGDRNPLNVLLDQAEDGFCEIFAEQERAILRECADREPAFLSRDSE